MFLTRRKALLSITMQPLDPITLAIIAVVVAVVLSALLLLLFTTREEKFEDVLAAQRSEQEAYLARTSAAKSSKPRKKFTRGKKKYSDDGEVVEEISEPMVEETVEASADGERDSGGELPRDFDLPSDEMVSAEEKPSSGTGKDRHGKKKSKKAAPKEETSSLTERIETVEKPREDLEEPAVIEDAALTLESPVDLEIEEQKVPDSSETAPSVKKSKSKTKVMKDKGPIQGEINFGCKVSYISEIFPPLLKALCQLQSSVEKEGTIMPAMEIFKC